MLDAIIEGIADALGHGVPVTAAQRGAERTSRSRWGRLRLPWRRDQGPAGRILLAAERDPDTIQVIYRDPPEERQMWRVVLHRNIRSGVTHWHADRPELHGIKEEIRELNGPKTFVFSKPGIYTLPVDQRPSTDRPASGDLDIVHVIVDHEVAGCILAVQNILEVERNTLAGALEQWRGTVWEHLRAQELFG